MGSFLTRGLMMIFGYAYPAYECFKTVERNKPEIEKLRFWCQYWILVAVLTVCERVGDAFISWLPLYSEAKLAFFIYLWYPKIKGTTFVYNSFFRPYLAKHETEIDRNLFELRNRAGDVAVMYWQRAASYGQTIVFEILRYVAAQSTSRSRAAQKQYDSRKWKRNPKSILGWSYCFKIKQHNKRLNPPNEKHQSKLQLGVKLTVQGAHRNARPRFASASHNVEIC